MKTRFGYVSNSSSSSFVIMYNDGAKLAMSAGDGSEPVEYFTVDDMLDLFDSQSNWSADSTQLIASGFDSMLAYVQEKDEWGGHFYDEERDEILKRIGELKNTLNNGAVVKLSYHDEFMNKLLKAFSKAGKVVILNEQEM